MRLLLVSQRRTSFFHVQEREARQRMFEELELAQCTFKPKTKWNLIEERRQLASGSKSIWDDFEAEDKVPLEVMTSHLHTPRKGTSGHAVVSPLADPVLSNKKKRESFDRQAQSGDQESIPRKVEEVSDAPSSPIPPPKLKTKLSAADEKEDIGKNTMSPTVVRSNYVGTITPSSPEWRKKFRQIGVKNTGEKVLTAEGVVHAEQMQLRG